MTKRRRTTRKNESQYLVGIGAIVLIVCLAGLRFLTGIDFFEGTENGEPAVTTEDVTPAGGGAVTGAAGDWYEIYFTDPTCPPEEERSGGPDEIIAEDIRQAQSLVDVAAFDFDSEPMVEALIELAGRGVLVRVVTDTDNADLPTIDQLRDSGIDVVEDERSALMHNKFVVIDQQVVWMGSMNFAGNDVYCHNNNIVRFDSPELAANYTAEMNEMVVDGGFGPRSQDATPNEVLTIDGVHLENYFASEKEVAPILADLVSGAQEEILFLAFSFTHEDIGEAMLERAEAGVNVRGVFETTGSDTEFSYYPTMNSAGLDNLQVRQDGNSYFLHHKVIILDQSIVIFGSFNFTGSANDSNDENVLVVHDPAFASFFVEEFETVWSEAKQ
ncbi:MAG: phospholipase D-like domain-containing protein [Chloroflexi bacterium]|nr:phospholipase D-like domain-containing protein [Chloroflexota bacterium]MCI0579622.1 phospholipase D-like domain-containing protein [Chloroflexota bacterium]MCI0644817.1 phospholipase D-like domain-containing protein [Chloroflexota bacterium]MCI0731457.1 phospholipase D-like domain-containing protein [Chloroflexota bacterium]